MADFNFMNSPSFGALGGIAQSATIADTRAKTVESLANTQHLQADTQKLNDEHAENVNFAKVLSGFGGSAAPGGPSPAGGQSDASSLPMSSQLGQLGAAALSGGAPQKGLAILKMAGEQLGQETAQGLKQSEEIKNKLAAHQAVIDQVGGMANQVLTTAAGPEQQLAYEAMITQALKDPNLRPEALQMPKLVTDAIPQLKTLVGESVKTKDQIAQTMAVLREKDRQGTADARLAVSQAMEKIAEARLRTSQDREARLAKNGGKAVGVPTKPELTMAQDLIYQNILPGFSPPAKGETDSDKLMVASQVEQGARDVALQAKQLAKEKGMPYQTALAQVVSQQASDGSWDVTKTASKIFGIPVGGDKTTARYKGGGATKETAVNIPVDAKGTPDAASLVPGHYYMYKGQLAQWTGKALISAGK